ncbi:MAG: mevalonate kinase [Anaerolineae bacterium]
MAVAFAPGKVILFGEHAVVYGRPAIAVPVTQIGARVTVERGVGGGILIQARDLGLSHTMGQAPVDEALEPVVSLVESTLEYLGVRLPPPLVITITSTIPMARGLGSGAAVSTALVRGLGEHFGRELSPEEVSALVYEAEKFHHGTPSGIDNTVISYGHPIYFVRGEPPQTFKVGKPFLLAIGDSGVKSPTKVVVEEVRRRWEREPSRYEPLFDQIGQVVERAKEEMEGGNLEGLGSLMDENQALLRDLGVSSPQLDGLVKVAREAGALGAKLSGAGRGGSVIALIEERIREAVTTALERGGVQGVITTEVSS